MSKKTIIFRKEIFINDMAKRRGPGETLLSELDGHYDWTNWLDGVNLAGKITGPVLRDGESIIYETVMFNPNEKKWEKIYLERRWLEWEE
jgi:hypothetical protein